MYENKAIDKRIGETAMKQYLGTLGNKVMKTKKSLHKNNIRRNYLVCHHPSESGLPSSFWFWFAIILLSLVCHHPSKLV